MHQGGGKVPDEGPLKKKSAGRSQFLLGLLGSEQPCPAGKEQCYFRVQQQRVREEVAGSI